MATYGQSCAQPMCVPPSYVDLGKAARDIFNTGFGFGLVKLDVKTKLCSGVEFSTSGSSNTDTGKVTGTLETRYKWCEYGLTFTEKWNTDNTLGTEIRECINLGCNIDFDFAGPAIHGSAVFGYEDWLAGYQMTFDSPKSKLTRNNFAVGYRTGDFQLHTNAKVNNSSLTGVGYTQTLRPGVKLTLSALVDGKSINAGGHKLGLALELEA
ncbi:unnamed protein product [Nyctereutes procyonoides]|uniref:Non-selective voltage-gated ion channel VDAC2 n=1 Tax=Nyctereutes procyonoides TaxID=34880 RepID=A0A811YIC8_NYCPR|nr:unnamed protein product [Nyctereutes procyonoides]